MAWQETCAAGRLRVLIGVGTSSIIQHQVSLSSQSDRDEEHVM